MPSAVPALSRRALLGGTAGIVALVTAGCSSDSLDPTSDDPTITPSGPDGGLDGGASTEPADGSDAVDDSALVAEVLAAVAVAHRTARVNGRVHPALETSLRPFARLHLAHAEDLGGLPRARGRVADPSEPPAAAVARVDRAEARLERRLTDAAVSAQSGALAQTFASMAAAVAQLRTTL